MDISAISTALATAMSSLGIHIYDYGPDQLIPPAAYIYPERIPYHETFDPGGDLAEPTWVIRILAASTQAKGGQQKLNDLITAAEAAIGSGNTLGNVVQGATVRTMRNYGVLQLPDSTRYYAADLVVGILV
jgi:hypothetical protein